MRNLTYLFVLTIGISTLPVTAEDHGEGPPPHWEPVGDARQALHDELGDLVESGDVGRIHELIGQLEEAFHAAVDADRQHRHQRQERHRAIADQFRQEHEEADRAADEAHRAADEARDRKHREVDETANQAHQEADRVADEAHRAADEARDQKHREIEERRHQEFEGQH